MGSSTNPLILEARNVLRRGVGDLIDDTEGLCTLVNDLQDEASELTPTERRFLDYLVPFHDKLVRDAPVIASVECAEAESQSVLSGILDKSWDLKEAMRMYEGTLSASFDMEEEYDRAIIKLQEEMELLEEKKKKLKMDIRDDISLLLERRQSLLELKDKQRLASIAHERTSAEMEVAELEESNAALKDALGEKYAEGFFAALEQIKVLFPGLDEATFNQADIMKVVEGDKLVPRVPEAGNAGEIVKPHTSPEP